MSKNQDNKIEGDELTWAEESKLWQDAAAADVLKHLGPLSKKECDYYKNLYLIKNQ